MKKSILQKIRPAVQTAAAVLFNGYAAGFAKGKIFTGKTKLFCVPVLNCYSCPGALGSCPIGGLQSVISDRKYNFSFYVLGFIMLFGIILGRVVCGFLCPFGFLQELIFKIPLKKVKVNKKSDRIFRYLKYVILVVFVFGLPLLLSDKYGTSSPYFCKWLCPAGTLEGGFPLLAANESLRSAVGGLFTWKVFVLIAVLLLCMFIERPFCKYLCPLGAVYGVFNRFSFFRTEIDKSKCTACHRCERVCPMQVEVLKDPNSAECIRCGKCGSFCPESAIKLEALFSLEKVSKEKDNSCKHRN